MEVICKKIVYNYCNKKYYSYLIFFLTIFYLKTSFYILFLQFLFFNKMGFSQKYGFLLCFLVFLSSSYAVCGLCCLNTVLRLLSTVIVILLWPF